MSTETEPAMTAEEAMAEIWAELCSDCGPEDYRMMVEDIRAMNRYLHKVAPVAPGALPVWLEEVDASRPVSQMRNSKMVVS